MNSYFPFLVEGKWHFSHQGLLPLRYAPHLCGGWPAFGNPNDLFYSVTQFIAFFLNPYSAILWSTGIYLVMGYIGWSLFGRDTLGLSKEWSYLFSLIVLANGFYFMHVLIGHINFLPFPLLGFLLWLIFQKKEEVNWKSLLTHSVLFGLISSICLYAGGYFVLLFFGFAFVLILPLDLILRGKGYKERFTLLLKRSMIFLGITVLFGISKLIAVYSLMNVYPRTQSLAQVSEGTDTLQFLFSSFFAIPQDSSLFNGIPWEMHEKSLFISPVVLIGAAAGISLFWKHKEKWQKYKGRGALLFLYFIFLLLFFIQLTRGYGFLISPLFSLPFLHSLRVATRFNYILSLIVISCSIPILAAFTNKYKKKMYIIITASIVTLACFVMAYLPSINQIDHSFNYLSKLNELPPSQEFLAPVEYVSDTLPNFNRTTTIGCYIDSIFQEAGEPERHALHVGNANDEEGGHFNLINPSCYQYGSVNNCSPGDPISLSDRDNFINFRSGKTVTWKISSIQKIADATTLISLILGLLWLIYKGVGKLAKRHN